MARCSAGQGIQGSSKERQPSHSWRFLLIWHRLGDSSHLSHDFYSSLYSDPDHRIRKRDVAVKILSNAVWFVRNYGPVAGVETMQGSDANDDASKDTTSHASDGLPPSSLASIRRTSESLLKKNSGLPNFLSKSSATTALSGQRHLKAANPTSHTLRNPLPWLHLPPLRISATSH